MQFLTHSLERHCVGAPPASPAVWPHAEHRVLLDGHRTVVFD
ncbi:hypothetical protein QO003_003435 [Arthrobacter silviterrae]|nr:hypothetical protein [Arthrobacter silviterrae]